MKFSLNWAKRYSNVELKSLPTDELVKLATERLGGVEGYTDIGQHYQGVMVVRVVSCVKHPNADKLQICKIDDGGLNKSVERDGDGNIQVVCGAPNVAENLKVAWLPPGVTVPSTLNDIEPLTLDTREIRGIKSNGMLGSAKELGLGDDHSGILILDNDIKPGTSFEEVFELDDLIIDIENKMFTHRPDCFGILGVAREIAGIQGNKFVSPEWYLNDSEFAESDKLNINIFNEAGDKAPRVMAVALDSVEVGPSPLWMKSYLNRVGIRSINNIVDVTNYLMYLIAQPMHAFDYDKLASYSRNGVTLGPRFAKEGEEITLLGNKKIKLSPDDIVLATDKVAVDIAGIMGGAETEVDANTKTILLTCCSFDMYSVRRTSMRHGIFTDAATRNTKGQPPAQADRVLAYAMRLLKQFASAEQASSVSDLKQDYNLPANIEVTAEFINKRLGKDFSLEEVKNILENVELKAEIQGEKLIIKPPFWRTDLEIAEDIVEEIGRLYGFNRLPIKLPKRSIEPVAPSPQALLQQKVRNILSSNGANELTLHSFISEKLMTITGQDISNSHKIRNALSPDLNYYRPTLLPSLLERVHQNHKAQYGVFALYEIGRVHNKIELEEDEDLPMSRTALSFVFSAETKVASSFAGAPFFQAKLYLESLAKNLGRRLEYKNLAELSMPNLWAENLAKLFLSHRSAAVLLDGNFIGTVGEFEPSVKSKLKLPDFSAGFEIDLTALSNDNKGFIYKALSKYPSAEVDVTYETADSIPFNQIKLALRDCFTNLNVEIVATPIDIFRPTGSNKLRYTFNLRLTSFEKTLTSADLQKLLETLDKQLAEKISAERI